MEKIKVQSLCKKMKKLKILKKMKKKKQNEETRITKEKEMLNSKFDFKSIRIRR
jgi:hypothetical protein